MQDIRPVNWLRIAALGVIWGAAFMATTVALTGAGPLMVVAIRLCLGAVLLLSVSFATGHGLPPLRGRPVGRIWAFVLAMGLFSNAMPFALLSWGQQVVASGFAGVCMAAVPLLVLPLAHVFVPGDRLSLRRLAGFGIGTAGVAVLIGPGAFRSTGEELELLARLACVGAAGCYAVGSILTRLCPAVDLLALAAAVLLAAAAAFTPYALYVEGLPRGMSLQSALAVLFLGLLPTGVAQVLLVQVVRDAGPVFLSLVNYQVPVWSVIFGVALLAEPLPPSLL
ncbi:MAG: DMT family transporter, partial [Roseovarius sp.]|nr:DMT family transporter [Roseovarius sp.]